jgi:hypothetical protein
MIRFLYHFSIVGEAVNAEAFSMIKLLRNLTFIFITVLFCSAARAEIIKVEGSQVLIRLHGKSVSVGEQLDVIDAEGRHQGTIKVTRLNGTSASAELESGVATVGMRVAKRGKTIRQGSRDSTSPNIFDFRVNPVGLISGGVDVNLDFRVAPDWTVGIQGLYLRLNLNPTGIFTSDYDISAYGFGARANWFSNGTFTDGFYFGPSFEYLSLTLKTADASGSAIGKASGLMASCLIGYGWFWKGFNIMLGGGYETIFGASGITIQDAAGNKQTITANLSGLTYELSMGWVF